MWLLFIAIVIGYLVFSSIHDHNKDVKTNVTDHGGMLVKYKVLIDYFTSSKCKPLLKQAICVNVLQMCCKYGNKQR